MKTILIISFMFVIMLSFCALDFGINTLAKTESRNSEIMRLISLTNGR